VHHTSSYPRNTGIQRCVRSIFAALIGRGCGLRPVVWDQSAGELKAASRHQRQHLARWNGPPIGAWADHSQEPLSYCNWLLIVELVSGPFHPTVQQLRQEVNRRCLKVAWVFHDALPLSSGAERSVACHSAYMAGLASFELVLANSEASARVLGRFLLERGHSPTKLQQLVRALPLATEFPGSPRGIPVAQRPEGDQLRLLTVSSLEPRKNHLGLLKAMAALGAQGAFPAELVLVGWANDPRVVALVQRVLQLGLPLRWEADVDDDRLGELYRWCDFTVYPSLEEGFGLPVAESLWQKRPCLCSGEGALGELAKGGGCLPVNTNDWRQLAAGLGRLLQDPALRRQLSQEASDRPVRPWGRYAQELLMALDQRSTAAP